MKISIVTPSYNQGHFIGKCLDMVRRQSHRPIEHIILDNYSGDDTHEHLHEYTSRPLGVDVKVLVERDGGQTAALNKGFRMACGDVICWLNTDEFYEPDALSYVADFLRSHPDVDVLFGDTIHVDREGKRIKLRKEHFFSQSMLMFYGCFIGSCSTFIRRRVVDNGLFLDEQFRVAMDDEWYVRLAKSGYRFAHVSRPLASFTWHDSNISAVNAGRRLHERRLIQDRYGGIGGPAWFRMLVYEFMRYFWITIRILRRRLG